MKITSAWIEDPTMSGTLASPKLVVEVDEKPGQTISDETFAGGWTVGKYGPFVKYSCDREPATAAEFNKRFSSRFPVVVDVEVEVNINEAWNEVYEGYALPLTRARQLVRKYSPEWRLLVSDRAAEFGRLLWVPIQTNPQCRYWIKPRNPEQWGSVCGRRPARPVRINGVDLYVCEEHLHQHNASQARRRAECNKGS